MRVISKTGGKYDEPSRNGASFEGKEYYSTVRHFGSAVEVSVRYVGVDEKLAYLRREGVSPSLLPRRDRTEEEQVAISEQNSRRSKRRSKQTVRWLLKTLQADHMLTLTYRENQQDCAVLQRHFQRFSRLVRVRYPEWSYVAVRERQDRGAWHLHIGVRGRGDVQWLRRCWYMALGHRCRFEYDDKTKKRKLVAMVKDGKEWRDARPDEIRGQIDLSGPSKRFGGQGLSWKTEKLAAYMTKYLDKQFDAIESGRRYWPSKGIQRPEASKHWLVACSFDEAVKEAHNLLRERFGCTELHMWSSQDMSRIWMSGANIICPF